MYYSEVLAYVHSIQQELWLYMYMYDYEYLEPGHVSLRSNIYVDSQSRRFDISLKT
jgi:hypothetical protein